MKKNIYILAIAATLLSGLLSSCVRQHHTCAAYDQVNLNVMETAQGGSRVCR